METYLPINKGIILDPCISSKSLIEEFSRLKGEYHVGCFDYFQVQELNEQQPKSLDVLWTEDKLIDRRDHHINEQAQNFARTWYATKNDSCKEERSYCGIDLGSLFVHTMTYYFVGLLKSLYLSEQFIKQSGATEVTYIGYDSIWHQVVKSVAAKYNVSCKSILLPDPPNPETPPSKTPMKKWVKGIVENTVKRNSSDYPQEGVVFSATMKFVLPLIRTMKGPKYYLREEFSWEAHSMSKDYGFHHIRTDYFGNNSHESHDETINRFKSSVLDDLSNAQEFSYCDQRLFPFVSDRIAQLCDDELRRSLQLIDSIQDTLKKLCPKSIFVDEDVCLFNKVLVLCAKQLNIPTYVLAHGVPYYSVGFAPLSASRILVWGDSSQKRLVEWGIDQENILVTGAPHYLDNKIHKLPEAKKAVMRKLNMESWQKIITLATQPFHESSKPDFVHTPLTPHYIKSTIQILSEALSRDKEYLGVIKLHPRDKHIKFTQECVRALPEDIQLRIVVAKEIPISEMIQASDLVITMGSTVYYEALLYDTPTWLIDDGDDRYFEFMSREFLNVKTPTDSGAQIIQRLHGFSREQLIQSQQSDKQRHFIDDNRNVLKNIESLVRTDLQKTDQVGAL